MPEIKKKIGKYEIVSILGKGAMGIVYKAYDPIIDRYVAIKTQHLDIPDAQSLRPGERFIAEARAVGRLKHQNIVGIYDFGEDDEFAYIVMELISGFPLTDFVTRKQPISQDEIWDTIIKVLSGIQYAHDCNIIHRDIKPANIMRSESADVKIADFGIAQIDTSSLTSTGLVIGTPRYMSPERISGKKGDHRGDIYSCGIVLHELLTGNLAFHDENSATVIYKIINTELPPVSELDVDCPQGIDAVIAKAVAKNPDERYSTAREFAEGIEKALSESVSTTSHTDTVISVPYSAEVAYPDESPASSAKETPTPAQEPVQEPEKESELVPPPNDSGAGKDGLSNDERGSGIWLWSLIGIVLVAVTLVLVYYQINKDDASGDELSPVDIEQSSPVQNVSIAEPEPEAPPEQLLEATKEPEKPEITAEAFSKVKTGSIFSDCSDCPSMVVVPPGRHLLGSTKSAEEQPVHTVEIVQPFAVAQFEVSKGEFAKFVGATGYESQGCLTYEDNEWSVREQRNWDSTGFLQDDTHPVVCVSWDDATNYIAWLSDLSGQQYRLLSSAEWEYLARGGHAENEKLDDGLKEICRFANVADLSAQKNYPGWIVHDCEDSFVHTAPVNSSNFKANSYAVSGLMGNVFEWVSDCWNAGYAAAPADGSARLTGDCAKRILRGGSWFSQPDYVRFGFRNRFDGDLRASTFGFRVARGLDPEEAIPTEGEPDS